MESDSWTRFAPFVAKRHQHSRQSRHDVCLRFEEIDGGDEEASSMEFACPFCAEDFDIVDLCLHIDDEHLIEAKNGVCPICSVSVGMDMVGHLTMQHGNFFKIERRRIFRRGSSGSHSTLSLLRKELREGHFQALLEGSSYTIPPLASAPDPFLSSLIYTVPAADATRDSHPKPLEEGNLINKSSDEKMVERYVKLASLELNQLKLKGCHLSSYVQCSSPTSPDLDKQFEHNTNDDNSSYSNTRTLHIEKARPFADQKFSFLGKPQSSILPSCEDVEQKWLGHLTRKTGMMSLSRANNNILSSPGVEPPLSEKDQEERAQRREFMQGLVLSTIFEDDL